MQFTDFIGLEAMVYESLYHARKLATIKLSSRACWILDGYLPSHIQLACKQALVRSARIVREASKASRKRTGSPPPNILKKRA